MQWNTGSSLWPRNETLVYEYSQNASPEEKIQNSGIGRKTHGSDDNHSDFLELLTTRMPSCNTENFEITIKHNL